MRTIDLNVDAGESYGEWRLGDDEAMFAVVTSLNLACGFHAGDPGTMRRTVALAAEAGVAIGAHPGLPDRVGFGRRAMALTPAQAHDDVLYQLGAADAIVRAAGRSLAHAKMHGALSTHVAETPAVADAIVAAVRAFDPALPLVAGPAQELAAAARRAGHPLIAEAFPERGYAPDGRLAPRGTPGAVINDPDLAAARAVRMVVEGTVEAVDGTLVEVDARTLCIHGDNPSALAIATAVRAALEAAGVRVAAV